MEQALCQVLVNKPDTDFDLMELTRRKTDNRQNHINNHKMTTGISAVRRYLVL